MPTARRRRYRHCPTPADALALVRLSRPTALGFETRCERGAHYGRAGGFWAGGRRGRATGGGSN